MKQLFWSVFILFLLILFSCSDKAPRAYVLNASSPANLQSALSFHNDCYSLSISGDSISEEILTNIRVRKNSLVSTKKDFVIKGDLAVTLAGSPFGKDLLYDFSDLRFGVTHTARMIDFATESIRALGYIRSPLRLEVFAPYSLVEANKINAFYLFGSRQMVIHHLKQEEYSNSKCGTKHDRFLGAVGLMWDGDAILHEFGHAMEDHLTTIAATDRHRWSSLTTGSDQFIATSEGIADFMSYALTGQATMGRYYSLLTRDSLQKIRPFGILEQATVTQGWYANEHRDGAYIASLLGMISKTVGVAQTLALSLEVNALRRTTDNFYDFGQNLLQADRNLNAGRHSATIETQLESFDMAGKNEAPLELLQVTARVNDSSSRAEKLSQLAADKDFILTLPQEYHSNGDGHFQPGECAMIEFYVKNGSQVTALGTEIIIDNWPRQLNIVWKNLRSNLGNVGPDAVAPTTSSDSSFRLDFPWIFACLTRDAATISQQEFSVLLKAIQPGARHVTLKIAE